MLTAHLKVIAIQTLEPYQISDIKSRICIFVVKFEGRTYYCCQKAEQFIRDKTKVVAFHQPLRLFTFENKILTPTDLAFYFRSTNNLSLNNFRSTGSCVSFYAHNGNFIAESNATIEDSNLMLDNLSLPYFLYNWEQEVSRIPHPIAMQQLTNPEQYLLSFLQS